jgi:hypothetical protein
MREDDEAVGVYGRCRWERDGVPRAAAALAVADGVTGRQDFTSRYSGLECADALSILGGCSYLELENETTKEGADRADANDTTNPKRDQ